MAACSEEEMMDWEPMIDPCHESRKLTPDSCKQPNSSNDSQLDLPDTSRTSTGFTELQTGGVSVEFSIRDRALMRIESILSDIASGLGDSNDSLVVRLRKSPCQNQMRSPASEVANIETAISYREVSFPGKTPEEAWSFTVVIRLLYMIHEALLNNLVLTKRDVFYRDPALFGKQAVVDSYVDSIARTVAMPRSALNLVAGAKGLLAGNISILRSDSTALEGARDSAGMLVPSLSDQDKLDVSRLGWVLVIEKEAVFTYLLSSSLQSAILQQGLLITAKGYPDISTRAFLSRLTNEFESQNMRRPIYGLFDFDPDGLGILSTYKHGSTTLAHEHVSLQAPPIQWLGLQSKDLCTDGGGADSVHGLLPLSARDRRKAIQMLKWKHIQEDGAEAGWRRELQVMLMMNLKAEIQLLDAHPCGLEQYIRASIGQES